MKTRNPKVDFFFEKESKWKKEYEIMRKIALDCNLDEVLKWGQPCYSLNNKNVVLIHGFKDYCAFLLFKGALLKDPDKMLIRQTENVQSPRQIRFTGAAQIVKMSAVLRRYIFEAIEVEKAGLKVELKKTGDYKIPEEFQKRLEKSATLKKAFGSLTPGRQRAYLFFFASAKQAKTIEARIDKWIPQILKGKGMDD